MLFTFIKKLIKKRNHRFNKNEAPTSIHYTSKVFHSSIGRYTYIGKNCDLIKSQIGRYCSIAQNVKVLPGTHPSSQFVSSHPFFYSASNPVLNDLGGNGLAKSLFDENRMVDNSYYAKVGNDVWIGANVTILSGITIGDGAIIGCGAVVTKDVKPYTIVGGVPAKYIKSRFQEEDIKLLIESKWWLLNHDLIQKNILNFQNISLFKAFLEKKNAS